jgi:hypothetical protein
VARKVQQNKRLNPRRPFRHTAWIITKDWEPLECSIEDVSNSGARLKATGLKVPEEFSLRLGENGSVGRKCQVVWRSEDELGVRFTARLRPSR